MSPRNEVLPLSFISLKYVSTLLIHTLSDDEGLNYELVERYLLDATYEVLQDLLKNILNFENLDASTRFSCLRIILREDIRRLDTGVFPHSYYEQILDVISVKGLGLNHLNIKGIWLRDYPVLRSELLNRLHNLRVLIIPHMPDDIVLETAMNCRQLTVLDISGECNFSADALRKFKSNHLKVLSIGMYGKKCICDNESDYIDVVIDLIKNLPNLVAIKTYSFTGSALLKIVEAEPAFKTKFTYIHDTNTSPEIITALESACPNLETATFNAPESNMLNYLSSLKRLNNLKFSEPNSRDVLHYLQTAGDKIQVLKLNVIKGDSLDVSQICVYAPELIKLECFKSKLICLQPNNYFINLQSLEILYCNVSDSTLKYFLQNSPFLRRIVVGDVIRMTDGDMFRLCAECDFHNLEELWFSSAGGLTVTSVELLMGHCPNLKVLGQLTGWDVNQNDLDYLRAVISSTNTDLTLLPLETLI